MTTAPKKTPMQMAGEVARIVELTNVATRAWSAQFLTENAEPPSMRVKINVEPEHWVRFYIDRVGKHLDLQVAFKLIGRDATGDTGTERVRITADLLLRYEFPDEVPDLSEEHFKHFAELNGFMNAWPYVREIVHSSTARMGLPPLVLPLLKASRLKPARKVIAGKISSESAAIPGHK